MRVKKSELNRIVLHQMRKIYYPEKSEYMDWMGFRITEENKPSYHHIEKKVDLKKEEKNSDACIENGAYLGKKSHELLHKIEIHDKELYDSWNYVFLVINKMKCYPIEDVWKMVFALRERTEELFSKNPKELRKMKREVGHQKNEE
jgi:hypothetical protein